MSSNTCDFWELHSRRLIEACRFLSFLICSLSEFDLSIDFTLDFPEAANRSRNSNWIFLNLHIVSYVMRIGSIQMPSTNT